MDLAISDLSESEQNLDSFRTRVARRLKQVITPQGSGAPSAGGRSSAPSAVVNLSTRPSILKGRQTEGFVNAPVLVGTSESPRAIRFNSVVRVINDGSSSPLKEGIVAYTGEWLRAERVEKRLEQVLSRPPAEISPQDIYDVVYAQSESMLGTVRLYDAAGPPTQHPNPVESTTSVIWRNTSENLDSQEPAVDEDDQDERERCRLGSSLISPAPSESTPSLEKSRSAGTKTFDILCCFRRKPQNDEGGLDKISENTAKCQDSAARTEISSETDLASVQRGLHIRVQTSSEVPTSPALRRIASVGLTPDFACEPIAAHLHIERVRLLAMDLVKYRAGNVFHEASLTLICQLLLPNRAPEIRTDQPLRQRWLVEIGCSRRDPSNLLAPYSMLAVLLSLQYISSHSEMARKMLRADQSETVACPEDDLDGGQCRSTNASTSNSNTEVSGETNATLNPASDDSKKPTESACQQKRGRFYFVELCLRTATALAHLLRYGRLNAICNSTDRVRLAMELIHAGWLADFWKRWERDRISDVEAYVLATQRKIADGIGAFAMIRAGIRTQDQSAIALYD
ncbi:hypothetical protein CCYA_CCYA10G2954 [Cyanidiococcus yangmingshanensis]|nr:hypothetical protein CCYA_CCYA10G2954 [Cyanidiococcus yangmingshanensis]